MFAQSNIKGCGVSQGHLIMSLTTLRKIDSAKNHVTLKEKCFRIFDVYVFKIKTNRYRYTNLYQTGNLHITESIETPNNAYFDCYCLQLHQRVLETRFTYWQMFYIGNDY